MRRALDIAREIGTVRAAWIEDNDRGDEDPSERPQWTAVVEVDFYDLRPLHEASFTHKVAV